MHYISIFIYKLDKIVTHLTGKNVHTYFNILEVCKYFKTYYNIRKVAGKAVGLRFKVTRNN